MKRVINYLLLFVLFIFPINIFAKENDTITLYLFHGDGCPHCEEEMKFLDSIDGEYDNFKIVKYEVWYNDDNSELLKKVQDNLDISSKGVPTNIIGNTVITGFSSSTGDKIKRAIEYYQKNEYDDVVSKIIDGSFVKSENKDDKFTEEEKRTDESMSVDVPFFGSVNLKKFSLVSAAALIGFIDGFNPCAMWVLLFLISVLIGMKNRRRMWTLGLSFLITSALVYMLIMLSWISIAVKITTVVLIRNIIAVVALIGGFINLWSYFKNRKESGCDVVDSNKRKKIFTKIKRFTSEKNFLIALIGVIGLAISVNLVELACSAGLPLVFSELLALNKVNGFFKIIYTLIYIFFFLIDDLVVFFIAMFTMEVTGISTKYNKFSHLIGGFIMVLIGILLLIKPEWLMFNFK